MRSASFSTLRRAVLERALAAGELVDARVDRLLLGQQALLDPRDLRAALAQLGLELVACRAGGRYRAAVCDAVAAGRRGRLGAGQGGGRPRPGGRSPPGRSRTPGATSRRVERATTAATTPATTAEAPTAPAVPATFARTAAVTKSISPVSPSRRAGAGPLGRYEAVTAGRRKTPDCASSIGAPRGAPGIPLWTRFQLPSRFVHSDRSSRGAIAQRRPHEVIPVSKMLNLLVFRLATAVRPLNRRLNRGSGARKAGRSLARRARLRREVHGVRHLEALDRRSRPTGRSAGRRCSRGSR